MNFLKTVMKRRKARQARTDNACGVEKQFKKEAKEKILKKWEKKKK